MGRGVNFSTFGKPEYYQRTILRISTNDAGRDAFWEEDAAQIGLHTGTPATPYFNLDEVYDMAEKVWLKKQDGVSTFFESNNNGMISSCGYIPDGCQDDCFTGINISLIEALQ